MQQRVILGAEVVSLRSLYKRWGAVLASVNSNLGGSNFGPCRNYTLERNRIDAFGDKIEFWNPEFRRV